MGIAYGIEGVVGLLLLFLCLGYSMHCSITKVYPLTWDPFAFSGILGVLMAGSAFAHVGFHLPSLVSVASFPWLPATLVVLGACMVLFCLAISMVLSARRASITTWTPFAWGTFIGLVLAILG